ncbi:sphingosine phosphate lyase, putative [Ixodes scapularis]|uniref:sphinganine-1-phosphate aldolase n=1 Tax=Ixodes scapularis TaxID=6945 RepID=B7PHK6_IXOSC|nr:sphingosine phosphate lyase, putative [Ixodes scapularis]|eukprot:XP_002403012.1 sphingosine phosphate lyase, putative [Ixodes scapularis]
MKDGNGVVVPIETGSKNWLDFAAETLESMSSFVPNVRRGILARLRNAPIIRIYVKKQLDKVALDIERSLNKHYANAKFILELPQKSWTPEEILTEMARNDSMCKLEWKKGCVSGAIYSENDERLETMMTQVFQAHLRSNPLHSDVFLGVRKMEAELIRWCCNLFHGGPESCGSVASGGTESLLLACKSYRDYAFSAKGIVYPEMIVPVTAHAGFDKAGQYLRIKVIPIPVDPKTMTVDVKKMEAAITNNTIMLVGSCPQFPHGAIDPIEQISELGVKYGVPVHVDACLGGFLVAFMEDAGFPLRPFDFRLPGVTSISADTPQGFPHFLASPATRLPGAKLPCPGCDFDQVSEVPGIYVIGSPDTSVVAIGSHVFDIFQLMEKLTHQRGWNLNPLQYPAGFHLCVTLLHVSEKVADRFVNDVRELTAEIMKDPPKPSTGQAAIYGMAQSLPDRTVVEDLARAYIDSCYSTRYIADS